MKEIAITDIPAGRYFSKPAFLDDRYIVLSPETPLTEELKNRLLQWGFLKLRTEGEILDHAPAQATTEVLPTEQHDFHDSEIQGKVERFYRDVAAFTEKLFANYVSKNQLPSNPVIEQVKAINDMIREHRRQMLRFSHVSMPDKNYLVTHTVKSAVLTAAVGIQLKLPPHKLIELGEAALLHEIGMVKLPPRVYMSDKPLDEQERKAIRAHPVLGYKILKSFSFPMQVCLAVLESHERVDGKGYPRGITGDKISLYGKVIFACDSYIAQISSRPFRDARDGHSSLLALLRERGTAYDDAVLRTLIPLISLYPVGTYVELANGAQGVVVEITPSAPKSPHVELIKGPEGQRYAERPVVRTTEEGFTVSRVLPDHEAPSHDTLDGEASDHKAKQ